MKRLTTIIAGLLMLLILSNEGVAQRAYTLGGTPDLKVTGTSTIHDWHMTSSKATGKAEMTPGPNGVSEIKSLTITMPVESLKSGKGQMDTNAYKALMTDKYKDIRFELSSVTVNGANIKANGKLTISGATKTVTVDVKQKLEGDAVEFTGTLPIKFSEFKVEPPTAVFGTIKTGDALQLYFTVVFK